MGYIIIVHSFKHLEWEDTIHFDDGGCYMLFILYAFECIYK